MHSTFDCKMSFLYWLSFKKDQRAYQRSWRINWKAHMHTLNLMCTHDISSLLPRKGHALSEHSELSCCRIWCYHAMEQHFGDRVESSCFTLRLGSGLGLGSCLASFVSSFNPFIPKSCQEKNLMCLLFLKLFFLTLWKEKLINFWGQ